ncbi:MAG TPA: hypothetical protein VER96_29125 [Polyangiaceae bacterium]|nr:hypothetical protein [Polyangiaceae bacterium]
MVLLVFMCSCGGRAVIDSPPADASPDASLCDRSPCVVELAAGTSQACARLDDGTVRCWGANRYGQAGVDNAEAVTRPVAVRLTARADKLRVGAQTSCAFTSGNLSCWGLNADFGLGPGIWADKGAYPVPVPVPRPGLVDIGLGQSVFCTLSAEGEVACAGDNSFGNTGLGADAPHIPTLTPLPNLRASALSVGDRASCAKLQSGGVSCWGDNIDLLIGPEADTGRAIQTPRPVPELARLRNINLSLGLACGVTTEQQIGCWGSNESANAGVVGLGPIWPPNAVAGSNGLDQPSVNVTACALDADGNVKCWGGNDYAQLGTGQADGNVHPTPTLVAGLSSITSLAVGFDFACALTRTGHVLCWGANKLGQLGRGQTDEAFHTPAEVVW